MAKRGRPLKDDDFFAMEVHRVMQAYGCGVRAACQRIARGGRQDKVPVSFWPRDRRQHYTVGGPWKGLNAGTLEQRYFRWLRREEKRQAELTLKIEFP
jgi:hypothetical protein